MVHGWTLRKKKSDKKFVYDENFNAWNSVSYKLYITAELFSGSINPRLSFLDFRLTKYNA